MVRIRPPDKRERVASGVNPLTPLYEAYCREHGLVAVAGSDCHDAKGIEQKFARHGGKEQWLSAVLERLDQQR